MSVEVVYASPDAQKTLTVNVQEQTTVAKAIAESGILHIFPEIDLARSKVGIFSKKVALDDFVKPGDRIEIYRKLLIDPKQKRRLLADKQKKK